MHRALRLASLALLILLITAPGFADTTQTISAGGIDFTFDLATAGQNYTLIFTAENTSGTSSATLNEFALQLFGAGSSADFTVTTVTPTVTGWTFVDGGKIDNNSNTLGCDSTPGNAGWLCGFADSLANALLLDPNETFAWTFTGTFSATAAPLDTFHFMGNGLQGITANDPGSKWAISEATTNGENPPPPRLPEPASLLMLGFGMTGIATLMRRYRK